MDELQVTRAFAALSKPTRLETVRLLAEAGEQGMLSGEIGAALSVRANTMSTNLGILMTAGLVKNRREGRTVRYFADAGTLRGIGEFLSREARAGESPGARHAARDMPQLARVNSAQR